MSSNAFARSRPQVRHQRAPKKQCYAHPRFLQLVKELSRIDDAKKSQAELEQLKSANSSSKSRSNAPPSIVSACPVNDGCSSASTTSNQNIVSSQRPHHHHHNHHHSHHRQLNLTHEPPTQPPSASNQQQQPSIVDCWPINVSLNGASCCRNLSEAHSSTSCRSLECNQPSSIIYRQSNIDNLPMPNPAFHQNYPRNYSYNFDNQPINNLNQPQQSMYRCTTGKCSSASVTTAASSNAGFAKSSSNDQSATDFSNSEPDHRQDENRSKRKRSSNDSSNSSKKLSQPASPSSCGKRHKASPEPVRPLSPSFTKCPICLLDCMDRDPSFTNTCFHLFCHVCIENWSKSKATCPLCRTKFTKIIYNIRSASCFDEKVASPIRRDDDDDRIIYEQLQGLNPNAMGPVRAPTNDEARLFIDNIGTNISSQFALLNHTLNPRHMSTLQSFNPVIPNSNFNSGVPHAPFTAANYNHLGPNYTSLFSSNDRSHAPASGPAITSAYAPNNSSNSSNRSPARMSRSGRYSQQRSYDLTAIDGSTRVSRSTNTDLNQSGMSIDRHLHYQLPHGPHHHHNAHNHQQQQQPQQHRATSAIELVAPRPVQRIDQSSFPFIIQARHFSDPHTYPRRSYINPTTDQHILESLYRPSPDMFGPSTSPIMNNSGVSCIHNNYYNIHRTKSHTLQTRPDKKYIFDKYFSGQAQNNHSPTINNPNNYANVPQDFIHESQAGARTLAHYHSSNHHHRQVSHHSHHARSQHLHSRSQSQHQYQTMQIPYFPTVENDQTNYYNLQPPQIMGPRQSPINEPPLDIHMRPLDSLALMQACNELGYNIDSSPPMPNSRKYSIVGPTHRPFKVPFPHFRIMSKTYQDSQVFIGAGCKVEVLGPSENDRSKFTVRLGTQLVDIQHQFLLITL